MNEYTEEEQADHREVWIKALRSGIYEQGQVYLRMPDDRRCCMGVACDITPHHQLVNIFEGETDSYDGTDMEPDWVDPHNKSDAMPDSHWFIDYYGISSSRQTDLANYNDRDQMSFEEIADVIEGWFE